MKVRSLITLNDCWAWLSAWLFVILLDQWGVALCIDNLAATSLKMILMIQSMIVVGLGYLLYPGWQSGLHRPALFAWCSLLAIAFLIATAIIDANSLFSMAALKTASAVFLLSLTMLSIAFALTQFFPAHRYVHLHILWLMLLFTTLPIWFAPWVETVAASPSRLHFALWSSPLSYLAAMLDFDYLRQQWFYKHLPYGMLRYDYPDAFYYSIGLITVSFFMLGKADRNLEKDASA